MKFMILIFIVTLFFFTSCSSLTKTQTNACDNYIKAINSYKDYAKILKDNTALVKLSQQKLLASITDSTFSSIIVLDSAIISYQKDILMPFELKNSFYELNYFVKTYSFKSSYNTDFLINAKEFMSTYIPFGIGDIVFEIIYSTRKIIIKPNIGRKIKKHILSGNETILSNTDAIIKYSETYLKELINEKESINNTYLLFIDKIESKPDSWELYAKYNPVYTENFSMLHYSMLMAEHLKLTSYCIKNTQSEFVNTLNKRKKIDSIPALNKLIIQIDYLDNIVGLIKD